jgi:hypothetical protein
VGFLRLLHKAANLDSLFAGCFPGSGTETVGVHGERKCEIWTLTTGLFTLIGRSCLGSQPGMALLSASGRLTPQTGLAVGGHKFRLGTQAASSS